jgi:hypothetical protein
MLISCSVTWGKGSSESQSSTHVSPTSEFGENFSASMFSFSSADFSIFPPSLSSGTVLCCVVPELSCPRLTYCPEIACASQLTKDCSQSLVFSQIRSELPIPILSETVLRFFLQLSKLIYPAWWPSWFDRFHRNVKFRCHIQSIQ